MPEMKTTRIFKETLQAWVSGKRRCLHEGGTASSKTWSILQALIVIASEAVDPLLISVVSESLPHLKRGAMRDFFSILEETPENNPYFNKTENIYRRPNWKGTIEFFGADDDSKVRGPRRQILFLNEANNIPWETARGLDIRTSRFSICDWNPTSEFWCHEYWLNLDNTSYCHSTYLDALDILPAQTVADIEAYKDTDPNWWQIYGMGLVGKVTGLVYPYFETCDVLPEGGQEFYGLDFGYINDPTVLVRCVIKDVKIGDKYVPGLFCQELIYESKLTNDEIANRMDSLGLKHGYDEIFADSAEPKSIEEIYRYNFNIKPTPKGPDSVEHGHQRVRQYKQYWTKDSLKCIKEQRNFRYIEDKNGAYTEKTVHEWSHGNDARRYGLLGYLNKRDYGFGFSGDDDTNEYIGY